MVVDNFTFMDNFYIVVNNNTNHKSNFQMTDEQLKAFYAKWCKDTQRGGGVLVGASIRELLVSFYEHINKRNESTNNEGRSITQPPITVPK